VLLFGRWRARVPLDVSCDGYWLDIFEMPEPGLVAPGQKLIDSAVISLAGIRVTDRDGKEFSEAFDGWWSGVGQDRRHSDPAAGEKTVSSLDSAVGVGKSRDCADYANVFLTTN
jgi:hypothetical protein